MRYLSARILAGCRRERGLSPRVRRRFAARGEIGVDPLDIEEMPAERGAVVREDRDILAIALLEAGSASTSTYCTSKPQRAASGASAAAMSSQRWQYLRP